MSRLYVAYGSNLNIAQMSRRCPDAKIYCSGYLCNWELVYRGSVTGAYATIRRKEGGRVPVVVWIISAADENNLDLYEGYPKFYFKQNVMVDLLIGRKKAMVYIMTTSAHPGTPSKTYENTIRQGYIDNGLDLKYFEETLRKNNLECFNNKKASSLH